MFSSSQMINGLVTYEPSSTFLLSIIDASNFVKERSLLWLQLRDNDPSSSMPWIVMGDFNCCRYQNEKAGDCITVDWGTSTLSFFTVN
ncbi:hypothetical protein KFK09_027539 [Dendrobium nobile]|uniref:Uncharacterized protein n=1 Tax=Dendrobium nobile TaxID=94219 RepID=A0A8T3AB14_DENNO|nr:hypothetical protein KFK09_027539 [Dendrobium nobile]